METQVNKYQFLPGIPLWLSPSGPFPLWAVASPLPAHRECLAHLYFVPGGPLQKSAVSNFHPEVCSRLAAKLRPLGVKQRRQDAREHASG